MAQLGPTDQYLYTSCVTFAFPETMTKLLGEKERSVVYAKMKSFASGAVEDQSHAWKAHGANQSSIRSCPIDDKNSMVIEVIQTPPSRPNILYHAITNQEQLPSRLEQVSLMDRRDKAAFTSEIPDWALDQPARLERIISSKAYLLLTKKQRVVLGADAPCLIDGRAGSGKTLILCSRLAGRDNPGDWPRGKQVFVSYSTKLVEVANKWAEDIFVNLLPEPRKFSGEFLPLRSFLLNYVPPAIKIKFRDDLNVRFGGFKKWYSTFALGKDETRKMPAETVWHGIRSILKGSCEPPNRPFPPDGMDQFEEQFYKIGKKRRDLPFEDLKTVFEIGKRYNEQLVPGGGKWDDQDLAWEALDWIRKQKQDNKDFVGYDRIFCDEVQDLTRIEFLALTELCKEPVGNNGLQLFMAGDPLQTINPSGFNWDVVRSEIFLVQKGRPVEPVALGENFRTDKRILPLANLIDDLRFQLIGQPSGKQDGFDRGGSAPFVIEEPTLTGTSQSQTKAKGILASLQKTLSNLGPDSAVIVWPEEPEEISALRDNSRTLNAVKPANLNTLALVKGLEFDRVYLYGFGGTEEAKRWKSYLVKDSRKKAALDEKTIIPLSYFLNRLYVAVTRARRFLIIIDTKEGIDNLWRPLAQYA